MNDDTSKAMDELKDRLGLDSLRALPKTDATSPLLWFEGKVRAHVFFGVGKTEDEALADLEKDVSAGRSVAVCEAYTHAFTIQEEAAQKERHAKDAMACADRRAAQVRADVAAAKRAKEAVS